MSGDAVDLAMLHSTSAAFSRAPTLWLGSRVSSTRCKAAAEMQFRSAFGTVQPMHHATHAMLMIMMYHLNDLETICRWKHLGTRYSYAAV